MLVYLQTTNGYMYHASFSLPSCHVKLIVWYVCNNFSFSLNYQAYQGMMVRVGIACHGL